MDFTALTDNAWAIFLLVGIALLVIGSRRGRIRGQGGQWSIDPERVSMPLVWAGIAVLALGGVYGLVLGIVQGNALGIVMSIIQLGVYGYIIFTVSRIQRRAGTRSAG